MLFRPFCVFAPFLIFYDPKLEIFDQALLADWETHQLTKKQRTLDGTQKVCALPRILAHMCKPMKSDNRGEMKAHIANQTRFWVEATIISYNRNTADLLAPDGKYSAANQDG